MATPIVLARIRHPSRAVGLLNLAASVTLVLALIVSGTRAGVIALCVGFLYMFIVLPHLRRVLVCLVGVATTVAYLRASSFETLSVVDRFTGAASGRASATEHATTIHDAWELWSHAPLSGWGFDTMRGAHNIAMQMLVAGGPLALLAFVVIVGGAWWTARRLHTDREVPADVRTLTSAYSASLLIWLTAAVVQSTSSDRYLYLPVAMILAVLFARRRMGVSKSTGG